MSIQLSLLELFNDFLAILTEDAFKSWHNRSNLDDLLDKGTNSLLNSVVGRLVRHLRLISVRVQNSKHAEDRYYFLRVSVDVLLEINQTVLDCRLQALLEQLVEFLEVVEPLNLDLLFACEE